MNVTVSRPLRLRGVVRARLATPAALVVALFVLAGVAQTALVPLLPRLAARDGLSEGTAAFVLALPGLAMLAVSLPAGMLADRVGARRVTLAAGGLLALGALAQGLGPLAALLAGRISFGLAYGALWSAGAAWLSAGVGGDADGADDAEPADAGRHPPGTRAVGRAVVGCSLGTMVGPALAGGLASGADGLVPFALIAGVAVAVTLALASLTGDPPRVPEDAPLPHGDAPPRRIARLPGRRRPGRPAPARESWMLAGAGSLIVAGALSGVTQLLVAQGLSAGGASAGAIGLAFSVCAVGYIAVSALFVRLGARAMRPSVNAVLTGLAAVSLVPAVVSSRPVVLIAALMLTAAPRGAINVVAYGVAAASERPRGTVFGVLNGAWGAATVLAPLLAGAVTQSAGARAGYLAAIVPAAAIAVALGLAARHRRAPARRSARVGRRLVGRG